MPRRLFCVFTFLIAPIAVAFKIFTNREWALLFELGRTNLLAILFLLSLLGWGALIWTRVLATGGSFINRLLIALVTGCCFLYVSSVLLAVMHLYRQLPLLVLLCSGVILALLRVSDWYREAKAMLQAISLWNLADRSLLAFWTILIGFQIVCGWTPLIFYDTLVYHLQVPAQYLQHGGFTFLKWNVLTDSPLALQLSLGGALALDRDGSVCKLIVTVLSCLMSIAAAQLARPAGRRAALIAGLLISSYPGFWVFHALGAFDLPLAALTVLGALWLRHALDPSETGDPGLRAHPYVLPAVAALGLVFASRYQSVIAICIVILVLSLDAWFRHRNGRQILRVVGLVSIGLVFAILPWIVKNVIYTGNPVFPLLYGLFDGGEWSLAQERALHAVVLGNSWMTLSPVQQLLAPFNLLTSQAISRVSGYLLLFTGMSALRNRSPEPAFTSGVLGFAGLIIWSFFHPEFGVTLLRFNAASILFLAVAGSCVLTDRRLARGAGVSVAVVLCAFSLWLGISDLRKYLRVDQLVTDSDERANFQRLNIPAWDIFEYANIHLDPSIHKVVSIGETRGFFLKIPGISPSAMNGPQVASLFEGPVQGWDGNFRRLRITHVVFSLPEWKRLYTSGYLNLPAETRTQVLQWISVRIVYQDGRGNFLLRVHPTAP